ncbi:MAG: hypothetical protein HKN63_10980 [Rhodobacteraceae bacterium]|nr:hypothetical protein [Paracoccaceae bacterium]
MAAQVRASTWAISSQTYQNAVAALRGIAATVGDSPEKSRPFADTMADPGTLEGDQYLQFAYLGIALFGKSQNACLQDRSGMIGGEFRNGRKDDLRWYFHRPGTPRRRNERKLASATPFASACKARPRAIWQRRRGAGSGTGR